MSLPVTEVFRRLYVPQSLRNHHYWVAGVAAQIRTQWNGPAVDFELLLKVLLVHDLGNLVKISDLDREGTTIVAILTSRFGANDHLISEGLALCLGLGAAGRDLMARKTFVNNKETAALAIFDAKIGAYADQRVRPDGVASITDRLEDARNRYKGKPGSSMNSPDTDENIAAAHQIEAQLWSHMTNIAPTSITTESVSMYRQELSKTRFHDGLIALGL